MPISADFNLGLSDGQPCWNTIYAAFFRKGTLISIVPAVGTKDALSVFLSRRDSVIRDVLKVRRPFVTKVAVLVADLQSSTKICAELPPEEYFELINQIWNAMGKHLRRFQGTHGKHVGDGLVYYFLPRPEGNYLSNAIQCAISMRSTMREISDEWSNRKGWLNGLKLNIGLDEGEEWFGSYQTPTQIEISALGDTINRTSRLSDFARDGTIWVTKNMISKLPEEDRCKVSFRIHHQSENEEAFVAHSYARISNLVNLSNPENKKLSDIATLAVTKII